MYCEPLFFQRKRKAESSPEDPVTSSDSTASASPPEEKRKKLLPAAGQLGDTKVVGGSKLNARSTASAVAKKAADAVSSYKTVADDPSARHAYKSLFNSGAKERPKDQSAHWVTFFPYH